MTTQLSLTANQVVTFALRKLGAIPIGQVADYNEVAAALTDLNVMLKGWEVDGPSLWRNTLGSVPLVPNAQSYDMTSINPLRIVELRYQYPDKHILPMMRLSRIEYFNLPLKSSAGYPTQWYFDPQENSQTLYVWPVLATVTTDQFQFTYQRRYQIVSSPNDSLDLPEEWLHVMGWNLAKELLPVYGMETQSAQRIEQTATQLFRKAKSFDRGPYVKFMPQFLPRR